MSGEIIFQVVEFRSAHEIDGYICFKDFCFIVSEKLTAEQDDETLVKTIFKAFKGKKLYQGCFSEMSSKAPAMREVEETSVMRD